MEITNSRLQRIAEELIAASRFMQTLATSKSVVTLQQIQEIRSGVLVSIDRINKEIEYRAIYGSQDQDTEEAASHSIGSDPDLQQEMIDLFNKLTRIMPEHRLLSEVERFFNLIAPLVRGK